MANRTPAMKLVDEAMFPRSRREERLGVDGDVVAVRIMLSSENEQVKSDALALALAKFRKTWRFGS